MPFGVPKQITRAAILKGKEHGAMKELVAAGAITPGHLVAINSAGKYVVHGVAKGAGPHIFADMNTIVGLGLDDAYAANDFVQAWTLQPGAEVNALVAAGAAAIAIGDQLESAGDGTLRKKTPESQLGSGTFAYTSEGHVVAVALVALDNSAGGSAARLVVMVA